jgi:hypothetical protein
MKIAALLITLFMFFTPQIVQACECLQPTREQAAKTYEDADIIINARIINPSRGFTQAGPIVTIEVLEVIKGNNFPNEMKVNYNPNAAACGTELIHEEQRVVALYDTRALGPSIANTRGYGFRLMSACQQLAVQEALKNLQEKEQK